MSEDNPTLRAISARVLRSQVPPDAVPLTLHAEDMVKRGQPHPERPGYVWVEDDGFCAGWVPADLLETFDGITRARAEYCSSELAVEPGDTVRLIWEDPRHGAWWCEDRHSERGWVRSSDLAFGDPAG